MSAIADQEGHVKESLFHFIERNIPSADLSVIDDIVLTYVISILEAASQDACFDVEGFVEMMSAYIPKFATIDPGLVCAWVLELEAEISRKDDSDAMSGDESSGSEKMHFHMLTDMLPPIVTSSRSHTSSECSETSYTINERRSVHDVDEYADQCRSLQEMFPNTCAMEIKHCVSIASGDLERAAATLLHRRENGQALSPAALHAANRTPLCDDREIKSRIIARYSYVDKNSENKEHKPLAPKNEPKKMVRYRDNKIVSLKGERYTEVPKSGADEENLKKPKKQHCP